MGNKRIPLEPDKYYHIYNHAVGNEILFLNDDNFQYFLSKYAEYCNPIVDTYAYCLMPNHFHFLIKMKSNTELEDFYKIRYPNFKGSAGFENQQVQDILNLQNSKHLGNFFNAYAKAFNKQQHRRGSLFEDDFKRIDVKGVEYIRQLIRYIHYNPVHHGFTDEMSIWKYSSFNAILSHNQTQLKKEQIINFFDDIDNFKFYHKKESDNFDAYFE